jgi:CO/xanthine dehydrogenase FAD-binding subunit
MDWEEERVEFLQPTSWAEALALKGERPEALPIAGGTDVMVELNFDARRPAALLDLTRVPELADWSCAEGRVRLGAGVSYTRVIAELAGPLPGLALAARTVGSPQIRNRGTVGGNLGAASPAGDCHPPLLATGAVIEVASVRGTRTIPADAFFTGVKRNALEPDELIAAVLIPAAAGPQQFSKIGTRNAMVIAVASFAVALDPGRKAVGTGIGSAAPTPRRATAAEAFLAGALDEAGLWESRGDLPEGLVAEFGALAAGAASPVDDVRGTAAYRRHGLAVMARRTLTWAWNSFQGGAGAEPGGRPPGPSGETD